MATDSRIVRSRSTLVLLRQNYGQHRMSATLTLECDVVSERIAEDAVPCFVEASEVGYSGHADSSFRVACQSSVKNLSAIEFTHLSNSLLLPQLNQTVGVR